MRIASAITKMYSEGGENISAPGKGKDRLALDVCKHARRGDDRGVPDFNPLRSALLHSTPPHSTQPAVPSKMRAVPCQEAGDPPTKNPAIALAIIGKNTKWRSGSVGASVRHADRGRNRFRRNRALTLGPNIPPHTHTPSGGGDLWGFLHKRIGRTIKLSRGHSCGCRFVRRARLRTEAGVKRGQSPRCIHGRQRGARKMGSYLFG